MQNPNLATPAINNRPAVVEDLPEEKEEDNLVLEPAEGALQRAQELYQGKLEEEPAVTLPPVYDAGPTPIARAEPPVRAPVEQPADLTVGDVAVRAAHRGVYGDPQPVEGLTLEPAQPVKTDLDPIGFLTPSIDPSAEAIQENIHRVALKETSKETPQLDIKDVKNYILWELLHKKENSNSNKEYALWINKLINTPYIDNMQSSREDGYGSTHKRQKNPYFRSPMKLIYDSRQDYLPLPIYNAESQRFEPYSLKSDGEFLISPEFKGAEGGQLYFDPEGGSIDPNTLRPIGAFQYWETTGEQFSTEADNLSRAIQRGAAEFPIFAVNIAALIDMGLNYTVLGDHKAGRWLHTQLGLDWTEDTEKEFKEAMERTAQGLSEFSQEYELAIAPWRENIGKFADPNSSFE